MLGGLWSYVRLESPSDSEQLQMMARAYPALEPLLPHAVSMLCLVYLLAGHQASTWQAADARTPGTSHLHLMPLHLLQLRLWLPG